MILKVFSNSKDSMILWLRPYLKGTVDKGKVELKMNHRKSIEMFCFLFPDVFKGLKESTDLIQNTETLSCRSAKIFGHLAPISINAWVSTGSATQSLNDGMMAV